MSFFSKCNYSIFYKLWAKLKKLFMLIQKLVYLNKLMIVLDDLKTAYTKLFEKLCVYVDYKNEHWVNIWMEPVEYWQKSSKCHITNIFLNLMRMFQVLCSMIMVTAAWQCSFAQEYRCMSIIGFIYFSVPET